MIEITGLTSSSGPLTKRISLSPEGKLISDGSACVMSRGHAQRVRLGGVAEFSKLIGGLRSDQAIALGSLRPDLPDTVEITTARRLAELNGSAAPGTISRTSGHIGYRPQAPSLVLLDFDTKAMPATVGARLAHLGGFWPALLTVAPELERSSRVVRRSTSSGIARADTGELLPGSDGVHVFVLIQDGSDAERFLKTLHDRCWLAGLGWMMVGAGGQFLERSIVDRMVYAAERLVFEGAPILVEPLVQNPALRAPTVTEGDPIDSIAACRALTIVERAKLEEIRAADRHRVSPAATTARAAFVKEHGARIAARTGVSVAVAERTVERQCGGVLLPNVELAFDADDMSGCTVGDVLADPARFVGATLADPLEGVAYGRCKAKILQRLDGSLWVNSFAHGRLAYELKHDAARIDAALTASEPAEAANVLVGMLLDGDVEPDEEQRLRETASNLSGVKARPLSAKIKAARAEQARARAKEDRDRTAATRRDGRMRLPAPAPDAERLPIVTAIDEVLCSIEECEPPMRDMDGDPVEVRSRAPMLLHELTSIGANRVETGQTTRLPAPELPLLSKHDKYSMAHLIERYIEFETPGGDRAAPRPVALPPAFVDHYMAYRESALPQVGGVVTAPLVLPDGRMLARQGVDVARKLVFRIAPQLLRLVEDVDRPSDAKVARALDYLMNDWLCDVATGFQGKCILIALALTIVERVLLPERPAFFVTAGKRGGGKTTALMMVILAVTGKKPAAAAWSFNEEERRKALVAYLSEGLAAMVFDNVPLGTTISCPTVEKILTAETYSDRVLGQSVTMSVQAFTVLTFTGNNIGPKGDLASRSLTARLDVDRPDPENRPFRHADPVAYTVENRGKILRALYTILRGNRQLREPKAPKTRFKAWWHLVGSALEHAAGCLVANPSTADDGQSPAEPIDFATIFRDLEGEDEEAASLGDVLDALHDVWPSGYFAASDLLKLIADPMEREEEQSRRVKEFFRQRVDRRYGEELTTMKVGRQLGAMVDTPIEHQGRTLKLIRKPLTEGGRRGAASYHVRLV
jgi:hypothetical protein